MTLGERSIGRIAASPIADPVSGEILIDRNETITAALADSIVSSNIREIPVRSAIHCEAERGVCQMCYGILPATGRMADLGQAVGIIAAQSIGEPGTQLTMRTFHTGGIASAQDITSGLPRVEELFEARVPKGAAYLAEIDGIVAMGIKYRVSLCLDRCLFDGSRISVALVFRLQKSNPTLRYSQSSRGG